MTLPGVTLRLRLVLALLGLLGVGLVLYGVATYSTFARSQYANLDSQLRSASPAVARQLLDVGGTRPRPQDESAGGGRSSTGEAGGDDGAPAGTPLSSIALAAELRNAGGKVVRVWPSSAGRPDLPASLPAASAPGRCVTVDAAHGSGSYRLLLRAVARPAGAVVVLATPTAPVRGSLRRLVLIEVTGGAVLLAVLCAGAWWVLRRELRPLERMAAGARSISAGDLSQRVSTAGPREVGELGSALNTMLDDIEGAFRDREATERRLRRFLADASHELRTPLTSIQGFAELFRVGGEQAKVDLPTILRRVEQEAARMGLLVEDLLLLARLDQARPVERQPVDLAVVAADACSDLIAMAPDRPVRLDAPAPVVVEGDRHHLQQAVANLVANAARHTPLGTAVEVTAAARDGEGAVAVRDHGAGVPPEALPHLFEPFWQADPARVGTGAGLGLSIVAGIAAEHGGRAEAANAPGGGALFTLWVPLAAPPAAT